MTRKLLIALSFLTLALPSWGAGVVGTTLGSVKAYPNPWRVDKHSNTPVIFDGMPVASTVKVFTVSGREVISLQADGNGQARWHTNNDGGQRVASGVYIYLVIDPQGNTTSGKLAIIY